MAAIDQQNTPIVAHLSGGPLDGVEEALFRSRAIYVKRVRRGAVRRLAHMPARYAYYELEETWHAGDLRHGRYEFRSTRSQRQLGPEAELDPSVQLEARIEPMGDAG